MEGGRRLDCGTVDKDIESGFMAVERSHPQGGEPRGYIEEINDALWKRNGNQTTLTVELVILAAYLDLMRG